MTKRYLRILLAGSLFSLTACAQQSEVRQMHQSISTLNKEMNQLNQETVKITQQNSLNREIHPRRVPVAGLKYAGASEQPDWHAAHVAKKYRAEC